MWISFILCIYAGSKNSWKFYKDKIVQVAGSQKRSQILFSLFLPGVSGFLLSSHNELGLF